MRAKVFLAMGKCEEASEDCEKVIERRDASSAAARLTLAAVRCKQNRVVEAANQLRTIVDANPDDTAALQRLAFVELKLRDFDSYRKTCARMLERFKDKPKLGSIISWPCILDPASVEDFSPIVELARKAVELSPTNYYRVNTLAGALYRTGKYSEALDELERSRNLYANAVTARIAALRDDSFLLPPSESRQGRAKSEPRQGRAGNEPRHGRAVDWAFLAMANFQIKQPARAEWWLGKLKETVDGASIGTEITADRQLWNRMELEILYREAEALIHPKPPSGQLSAK
jgi:tetratricopeptide (TPR) repeat protein